MENWQKELQRTIVKPEELAKLYGIDVEKAREVARRYPVRIPRYYLDLIGSSGDPLGLQSVPAPVELEDPDGLEDPLAEESQSPVPGLVWRYPDRALLLVTTICAMYCRFCTRKRLVGKKNVYTPQVVSKAIEYIAQHPAIRDVIISGGDPLTLDDATITGIVSQLRKIAHVDIIRIDTKTPCVLPSRITDDLCRALTPYHPIYINTHFNHPRELTPQAREACERLVNHGFPVGNQTVLLKDVNDDPQIMKELMLGLLKMRVKPYYLYQCDLIEGGSHFRTPIEKGLEIIEALRGHVSGMAVPHFVVDAPGGGGKIPLIPETLLAVTEKEWVLKNFEGKTVTYPRSEIALKSESAKERKLKTEQTTC